MTNKSASIANLTMALSKAQAKMPVVPFDSKNPFLKNSYASLGSVISTSKPILAEFGLSVMQFPASHPTVPSAVGVTTIVAHESGEWIEETCYMIPEQNKGVNAGQAAGITISYLRRYAHLAALNMYAGDDFDNESLDGVESSAANDVVSKIMADPKTGEVAMKPRIWSIDQMEVIVSKSEGTVEDHEAATRILNFSALPDTAPLGTVESWFKHYMKSNGDTEFQCAADANKIYQEAKKKTGGKK